jgi:hypothetical protein
MNNTTLDGFRQIADAMGCNGTWQWIGPHMSQRMFGITQERAESYAKRYGGEAKPDSTGNAPSSEGQFFQVAVSDAMNNEAIQKALRLKTEVLNSTEKEGWIVVDAGIKTIHSPRPLGARDIMKLRIELDNLG